MSGRASWVSNAPLKEVPEVKVLPPQWRAQPTFVESARSYRKNFAEYAMNVIVGVEVCSDGSRWLHVSASRPRKVPSYQDLCEVWTLFGEGLEGIQKFVRTDEHVNDHANVLHLWGRLDAPATPDFRRLEPDLGKLSV